ncbi:DcaP family trimeric outer membrane transporter [Robiginitalea aurantiaca]|uniref:DcaP family trimeric outer membrane transporter n=1 Tax=Robiginitalea aurantiaca TaxID=3056915 RepID=A0ABT7WDA9_9FLAO|nr:DcaP family trimeric outer membrane transporter [Robiginitalea aurantiaca]MDM9630897.1 DcaP family trimeric outer membrane transporter [Robiginitalea aurantiaca]
MSGSNLCCLIKHKILFWIFALLSVSGISQENQKTGDAGNTLKSPDADVKEQVLQTAAELLEDNDFPGSWPLFGTDLRMKIGGYLKADFLYDFDGTTDQNQFLMSTIPVEGEDAFGNEGYLSFFAKETRVNIDLRRVAENKIPLQLFIEGDFFTQGNGFRLRHAYMTAGDFIIGQTWTTLSFLESMAFMIDFAAGDALFGGRTAQVRYQKNLDKGYRLSIGLEYLGSLGIENSFGFDGKANLQLPLLALRLDKRWETGVLFMGASLAQLRWDGGDTGPSDQLPQLAFVVAGRQYLGENNYFTWNVNAGSAYGENIISFAGSSANALLNENGELEPIEAFALMAGFMHRWAPGLESNFNYAYGWLDAPETRADFALKRGGVGHLNLIYHFDKNFSIGAEYMWGAQRTANDAYGSAGRLQTMAKFEF